MNRDEKLAKLKEGVPKKVINLDGKPFLDELEKQIDEFKSTLDIGIEVKNIDELLDQLGVLQSMHQEVKSLKTAIKELKLPSKLEVDGLVELTKQLQAVANIKEISLDKSSFDSLKPDNIFDTYKPAQTDEKQAIKYYGYLSKDGNWFIMRESETGIGKRYLYSTGKDDFSKAFNSRAKLDYKFINEVSFE